MAGQAGRTELPTSAPNSYVTSVPKQTWLNVSDPSSFWVSANLGGVTTPKLFILGTITCQSAGWCPFFCIVEVTQF